MTVIVKLHELQNIISQWKKRYLTIFGKITVIKTILLSKITHLLITLPTPNTQFIKNLENMFYDFIWCSKTHRVSKNQMIKDYNDGGCRMVHVPSFIKSLKLSWIKRLFNSEATWTHLFFASFKTDLFKLQLFGNSYAKLILSKYKMNFEMKFYSLYMTFKI